MKERRRAPPPHTYHTATHHFAGNCTHLPHLPDCMNGLTLLSRSVRHAYDNAHNAYCRADRAMYAGLLPPLRAAVVRVHIVSRWTFLP